MPLILAGHRVIIPSRLCSKREFRLTKSDKSVALRCSTTPNSSEKKHQKLNLGAHRADHLQGIVSIATDSITGRLETFVEETCKIAAELLCS